MIAKEGGVGVYRSNFIKLEQPSMLFVRTTFSTRNIIYDACK